MDASVLATELGSPASRGRGGRGGRLLLMESELQVVHCDDARVRAEPFDALELELVHYGPTSGLDDEGRLVRFAVGARLAVLSFICGTTTCAATRPHVPRYTAPVPGAFEPRRYTFRIWKGRSVAVAVVDDRTEPVGTDTLVGATRDAIEGALAKARIALSTPRGTSFDVSILRYRTDYIPRGAGASYWHGCARFLGVILMPSGVRYEVPVERCVTKSGDWGTSGGDESLHEAFSEAIGELLARVDELGE